MPRINVKQHHTQYLELLSGQMGCNVTEALNFLIFELKRQNFSFSSALPTLSVPQPLQQSGMFVPFQEIAPVTSLA